MPRKSKAWTVVRAFDFVPRPTVVQTFRPGQEVRGLPRACVAKGLALGALKPKETRDGEADDV